MGDPNPTALLVVETDVWHRPGRCADRRHFPMPAEVLLPYAKP
jgi:hypothetical protein